MRMAMAKDDDLMLMSLWGELVYPSFETGAPIGGLGMIWSIVSPRELE